MGRRFNVRMPYLLGAEGLAIEERLVAFGLALRHARYRTSLTQARLEDRSGVDQTLISRLERGKAPHCSLNRILSLQEALGRDLPLGVCPHEHVCDFRPPGTPALPSRRFDWREVARDR